MNRFFSLLVVSVVLALTGCNEDYDNLDKEDKFDLSDSANLKKAEECAIATLKQNADILGASPMRNYIVSSVRECTNKVSRSDQNETSNLYVVNFEDGGFAIVGANDKVREKVYAFSDKGSIEDTDGSMSFLINLISDVIANEIPNFTDSIPQAVGYANIPQGDYIDLATVEVEPGVFCIPRLTTSEESVVPKLNLQWHQSSPYNKFCLDSEGNVCAVGCGPLAMGQIMAYHKKPASYNGYTYPWDMMTLSTIALYYSEDAIANLLHHIGIEAHANYGGETETTRMNMLNTFKTFGYKDAVMAKYYAEGACQSVKTDGPVCVMGSDPKIKKGHAWVVDGYKSKTQMITYLRVDDYSVYAQRGTVTYYLHCKWGWSWHSTTPDDFYLYGNFNTDNGNFNSDIEFIYNIK